MSDVIELRKTADKLRQNLALLWKNNRNVTSVEDDRRVTEIMTALFFGIMKLNPKDVRMADRDRFLLGKGQSSAALYTALAMRGFFPLQELIDTYGSTGSRFGRNPGTGNLSCVEASTGLMGHGLPIAVGMAIASRIRGQKHRVFILLGEEECTEGSTWEAALTASEHELGNLTAIIVCHEAGNPQTETLEVDVPRQDRLRMKTLAQKWQSFGWNVLEIPDGNDLEQILSVIEQLPGTDTPVPSAVIVSTA